MFTTLTALLLTAAQPAPPPPTAATPTAATPTAATPKYDPYRFDDYAEFRKFIAGPNGWGALHVGVEDRSVGTYEYHCRVPSGFKGLADGVYDCRHDEETGRPIMIRRVPKAVGDAATAPVVYHEVLGAVVPGPPVYYNSPPARTAWLPPQQRTRGDYWWAVNRMGGGRATHRPGLFHP